MTPVPIWARAYAGGAALISAPGQAECHASLFLLPRGFGR
jgi:hypothetical protein